MMINRFRYALLSLCLFATGILPGAEETKPADSLPQKDVPQSADPNGSPTGASLRDAFQASVEEYRKSATEPNAKKMAELYKRLTPAPALPEEAEFHAAKGAAFAKLAKVPADFERAAKEFLEAVSRAPWHGEFHFNQAVCLKSAGQFAQALVSLKMAHLLARDDTERRDALAMRAEIEASQEMSAKEAAGAAKKEKDAKDAMARLAGMWVPVHIRENPGNWRDLKLAAVDANEMTYKFSLNGDEASLAQTGMKVDGQKIADLSPDEPLPHYSASRLNAEWSWAFSSYRSDKRYKKGELPVLVSPVVMEILEQGNVIRTKMVNRISEDRDPSLWDILKSAGYIITPGPKGYVLAENRILFVRIGD